jgi:hypothetical protein
MIEKGEPFDRLRVSTFDRLRVSTFDRLRVSPFDKLRGSPLENLRGSRAQALRGSPFDTLSAPPVETNFTCPSAKHGGPVDLFDRTEGREAYLNQLGLPGQAARLAARLRFSKLDGGLADLVDERGRHIGGHSPGGLLPAGLKGQVKGHGLLHQAGSDRCALGRGGLLLRICLQIK